MKPQQMVSAWTWLAGDDDGSKMGLVHDYEVSRSHERFVNDMIWDVSNTSVVPSITDNTLAGWSVVGGLRR